uniref:Uncharacterized protein n=1 Tax=Oryza meridionalis TaxID=40149 RepID=A0A0E0EBG5_9ORYZ
MDQNTPLSPAVFLLLRRTKEVALCEEARAAPLLPGSPPCRRLSLPAAPPSLPASCAAYQPPPPTHNDATVALAIGPGGREAYVVARTRAAREAGEEEAWVGGAAGETTGRRRKAVDAAAMVGAAGGSWPPTSPHHQCLPHRADSSPTSCAAASPRRRLPLAPRRRRAGDEAGLLGLRHGELGVAIGGGQKGILGSPGGKSGENGMKWLKWQNKYKPSLDSGILTTPFRGMALWRNGSGRIANFSFHTAHGGRLGCRQLLPSRLPEWARGKSAIYVRIRYLTVEL